MLAPFREQLDKMKVILGSSSPRRRELLAPVLNFEVVPSDFDESTIDIKQYPNPTDYVKIQAQKKCEELAQRIADADIIITADTMVVYGDQILGKPKTHEEAYDMIKLLNGTKHTVVTGVYISMPKKNKNSSFSCETIIYFDDLPEDVMKCYAYSDDPMDKAGGYGYQSYAISLVKKIDGDFGNSVGMPANAIAVQLYKMLSEP
ncbi:maf protein [Tritrichomonas foetus]|uniref:Maf protein n=1 Tax=Tritrichomonas foetus TaxID=1144522 RepID=A0A1J4JBH0_9EUKA|nr:maf protein [Tritrichomonas foetus]|eukprot:OHS96538.1 maf protein [Tritrichomonas foetus]